MFSERLQSSFALTPPRLEARGKFERLAPATWPNDAPHLSHPLSKIKAAPLMTRVSPAGEGLASVERNSDEK